MRKKNVPFDSARRLANQDPAKTDTPVTARPEGGNDLGFGNRVTQSNIRLINPDGSFNVRRTGLPFWQSYHPYQTLITMPWWKFTGIIVAAYLVVNAGFALLYMSIGMQSLAGALGSSWGELYLEAFFFSTQTFTTVGYGRISPVGTLASGLAALESMLGLLAFALATGLLFARVSRPVAKVMFSKQALIAPYAGGTAFEFRIANARKNQLIEVEVQVSVSRVMSENGKEIRRFYDMPLERSKVNFFPLSWTLVHPITDDSPLQNLTAQDLEQSDAEFLIIIKAFDDTFSQYVYARYSYRYYEMVWGAKFTPIFHPEGDMVVLKLDLMDQMEKVALPVVEAGNSPSS